MSFWNWLLGRPPIDSTPEADSDRAETPIRLPVEPLVFECNACGKVFEARRLHPLCPECDADDVTILTELDG